MAWWRGARVDPCLNSLGGGLRPPPTSPHRKFMKGVVLQKSLSEDRKADALSGYITGRIRWRITGRISRRTTRCISWRISWCIELMNLLEVTGPYRSLGNVWEHMLAHAQICWEYASWLRHLLRSAPCLDYSPGHVVSLTSLCSPGNCRPMLLEKFALCRPSPQQ